MHFHFCKATICDFCAITAFGEGDERSNKTVFEVRYDFKFLLLPITPSRYSRNTCRTDLGLSVFIHGGVLVRYCQ